MATDIKIQLEFVTRSETLSFAETVTDDIESTDGGKEALSRELFAELRKAVSFKDSKGSLPDLGDALLEVPSSSTPAIVAGPMSFIDIFNRPAIWLEIHNTFVDLRFLLPQALRPFFASFNVSFFSHSSSL
jgi:hypothetical protein